MGSRFPDAGVSQSPDTVIVPDHGIRTLGSFGRNYGLGHPLLGGPVRRAPGPRDPVLSVPTRTPPARKGPHLRSAPLGENGSKRHGRDHETPAKLTLHKGSQYHFTYRSLEINHRKSSPRFRKGGSSCIDICGRDVAKIDVLSPVVWVDAKFFRFRSPSGKVLHAPADSALENADCTNLSTIL